MYLWTEAVVWHDSVLGPEYSQNEYVVTVGTISLDQPSLMPYQCLSAHPKDCYALSFVLFSAIIDKTIGAFFRVSPKYSYRRVGNLNSLEDAWEDKEKRSTLRTTECVPSRFRMVNHSVVASLLGKSILSVLFLLQSQHVLVCLFEYKVNIYLCLKPRRDMKRHNSEEFPENLKVNRSN